MSAIKVGDLVMVVRPRYCCPHKNPHLGTIFKVSKLLTTTAPCDECGDRSPIDSALAEGMTAGYNVLRLKRIPPLDELERDQIVKKLTA
jgi:hypothetical protein